MYTRGSFLFLLTLLMSLGMATAQQPADTKDWIQLFNGKDLKDWEVKIAGYMLNDNFGDTFRVEDGKLKVAYDKYESFGNLIHSQSAASMTKDQDFPIQSKFSFSAGQVQELAQLPVSVHPVRMSN